MVPPPLSFLVSASAIRHGPEAVPSRTTRTLKIVKSSCPACPLNLTLPTVPTLGRSAEAASPPVMGKRYEPSGLVVAPCDVAMVPMAIGLVT